MSIKYSVPAEKREELNALSKEVYNASSRWLKLMETGRRELVTTEVEEEVPSEKEGEAPTKRMVKVPAFYGNSQTPQYVIRRLTLDEVETEMRKRKEQLDAFRAAIKAQQDAAKKAKEQEQLEKNVAQHLTGSAV
jgi:hypothetical protein